MKLPQWLYEILPTMYLVVGLLIAASEIHAIGIISGIILVVVGVIIINMRLAYRRRYIDRHTL